MNISIGKFLIESDASQFTLYEKGVCGAKAKNPGKESRKIIGHYPTLKCCLECFPDRALMLSGAEGIDQVLDELQKIRVMIVTAMKGM